jgi:hypothetical protein
MQANYKILLKMGTYFIARSEEGLWLARMSGGAYRVIFLATRGYFWEKWKKLGGS